MVAEIRARSGKAEAVVADLASLATIAPMAKRVTELARGGQNFGSSNLWIIGPWGHRSWL